MSYFSDFGILTAPSPAELRFDLDLKDGLKLAEAKITTVEENSRPSIANHTAGMITDTQNKIISVSPSFATHLGYTLADCIGQDPSFLHGPGTSESGITQLRSYILTRKQGTVTVVSYDKSGNPFLNEIMIFPMNDLAGEFLGFTYMFGKL